MTDDMMIDVMNDMTDRAATATDILEAAVTASVSDAKYVRMLIKIHEWTVHLARLYGWPKAPRPPLRITALPDPDNIREATHLKVSMSGLDFIEPIEGFPSRALETKIMLLAD